VPIAARQDTAGAALRHLGRGDFDSVATLYVLDDLGRLCGRVPLAALLRSAPSRTIAELLEPPPAGVPPGLDQEEVAAVAVRHGLSEVPITAADGRFLGVVPALSLLAILQGEHTEDLNLLVGLQHRSLRSIRSMVEPPLERARERLPWLLVGLAGCVLATFVMSRFEAVLSRRVLVAFFIPGLVYLADAIGTQSEAIAVRGFAIDRVSLRRALLGEIQTGFLIGLTLGILSYPAVLLGFGSSRLAAAVALSIFLAGGVATSVGILLPWWLDRAGKDPAYGSGPVATIIQDVLSLLVYFAMVGLLGV
jgi:magnesium transporter